MRFRLNAPLLLVLTLSLFAAGMVRAGTPLQIELIPSTTLVELGGTVDVTVRVTGLSELASPSLGAYDLAITFDPTVFAFDQLTFLGDLGPAATGSMVAGTQLDAAAVSPSCDRGAQCAADGFSRPLCCELRRGG